MQEEWCRSVCSPELTIPRWCLLVWAEGRNNQTGTAAGQEPRCHKTLSSTLDSRCEVACAVASRAGTGQALRVQQLCSMSSVLAHSWASLAWLSPSPSSSQSLPSSDTALTFLPGRLLSCCSLCFQGFSQTTGPFQDRPDPTLAEHRTFPDPCPQPEGPPPPLSSCSLSEEVA